MGPIDEGATAPPPEGVAVELLSDETTGDGENDDDDDDDPVDPGVDHEEELGVGGGVPVESPAVELSVGDCVDNDSDVGHRVGGYVGIGEVFPIDDGDGVWAWT